MIRRIILVSFFFCSLLTFASDLEGEWAIAGYMCRSSDGSFTHVTNMSKGTYYNVEFHANNIITLKFFLGCTYYGSGTYSVVDSYLNIRGIFKLQKDLSPSNCIDEEPNTISISGEFILKDDNFYIRESRLQDNLIQKCVNGTIFHKLVRKVNN